MGKDMSIRITKYEENTNKYHEICLYRLRENFEKYDYKEDGTRIEITDPYIRATIDPGRNYDMFDGMKMGSEADGYGHFPWRPLHLNSLEDNLKEELKSLEYCFDFYEIYLSELDSYVKLHPYVTDYEKWEEYDEDEEKYKPRPQIINPIKSLYEEIYAYVSFADWLFDGELGEYKIIFYFDC